MDLHQGFRGLLDAVPLSYRLRKLVLEVRAVVVYRTLHDPAHEALSNARCERVHGQYTKVVALLLGPGLDLEAAGLDFAVSPLEPAVEKEELANFEGSGHETPPEAHEGASAAVFFGLLDYDLERPLPSASEVVMGSHFHNCVDRTSLFPLREMNGVSAVFVFARKV